MTFALLQNFEPGYASPAQKFRLVDGAVTIRFYFFSFIIYIYKYNVTLVLVICSYSALTKCHKLTRRIIQIKYILLQLVLCQGCYNNPFEQIIIFQALVYRKVLSKLPTCFQFQTLPKSNTNLHYKIQQILHFMLKMCKTK